MKSYTEIKTQEDMEKLLSSIACFHDSMTKEIHIVNRGWVNRDHSMAMSHSFDLQLLIQSQWEPYAIELVFCNVIELHLSDAGEYWDATGSITRTQSPAEKTEIRLSFDSSLIIKASQLYYKNRSDWLGKKSFLKHEVPSSNAIPAKAVEHNWRQCQECFDAWEEI
ncbi:hypothetical protein [Desulforegula conservatrix]|uniref:hypothetical protein n=1 Tax=Desulforegula conservatrix TaxID=153026 RepID=UPI000480D2B7|nr:hypothetical protein [Desulforegula conservatrix]